MTAVDLPSSIVSYASIIIRGETRDAELEPLRAYGCTNIVYKKASEGRADRHELLRLPKSLCPGDAVTVTWTY